MFKVTFEVSATRLESLLTAASGAGFTGPAIAHVPAAVPAAPVSRESKPAPRTKPKPTKLKRKGKRPAQARRMPAETILTLTGRTATPGSGREKILHLLEALESKRGIGTITREILIEGVQALGMDRQIVSQLVNEKYLKRGD